MLPVALSQKAPTVETMCPPLFLPVRILEKCPVPQFADSRLELVPQMSVPGFPPQWALQELAGEFLSVFPLEYPAVWKVPVSLTASQLELPAPEFRTEQAE